MNAGGLTLHIFVTSSTTDKGGFMVTYSDLPPEVLKAPKPEKVLESGEKGLVDNFKATITKSEAALYGPKKYPARIIVAEQSGNVIRGSIVLAGSRLYQVYAFGSKEFTSGKDADDFISSFTTID